MDLNGKLVCLIAALTMAITKVAAINVAGTINQGASSINSRIVLILLISLKFFWNRKKSPRVLSWISRLPFHEQTRISVISHMNLLFIFLWLSDFVIRNSLINLLLDIMALGLSVRRSSVISHSSKHANLAKWNIAIYYSRLGSGGILFITNFVKKPSQKWVNQLRWMPWIWLRCWFTPFGESRGFVDVCW